MGDRDGERGWASHAQGETKRWNCRSTAPVAIVWVGVDKLVEFWVPLRPCQAERPAYKLAGTCGIGVIRDRQIAPSPDGVG